MYTGPPPYTTTQITLKMAKWSTWEKEMAKMLSEDLISEILVRLPVKSLLRCRCVCKAWFRLIKSPNFVDMHLNRSKKKTDLFLLYLGDSILSVYDFEPLSYITKLPLDRCFNISWPCNGLICMNDYDQFTLFNPSTNESAKLPPCPLPCAKGWKPYILGFGLGFVSSLNDYKVVVLVDFYDMGDENEDESEDEDVPAKKVEIYNSSTNSWREIECDCPDIYWDDHGTLFNGELYWIAKRGWCHMIASFNLSTEVFSDIAFPKDVLRIIGTRKSLTILNNSLALFVYTDPIYNSEEQFIDMWVIREYEEAKYWTKQIRIGPLSGILFPRMLCNETIIYESSENQLLSCDIDTDEIKEVVTEASPGMLVMAYHESLISPSEIIQQRE